ncbi:MAG TPA: hypothetical protein VFW44_09375 [Bryobacteraceae bacterium]|nr:hypothetical protein [Bryobacteraceae bacterium]
MADPIPPVCEPLLAMMAEAALRLNSEPDVLRRMLATSVLAEAGREETADPHLLRLQNRLALAAIELAEGRHALNALRNSWSWRVTAPLRALADAFRLVSTFLRHGSVTISRNQQLAGLLQWLRHRREIRASGLFDERYYLLRNPDVQRGGVDPLLHYFVVGWAKNRQPNWLFDGKYYRENNSLAGMNPLVHYLKQGARKGRNPHPQFDTGFYLDQYPEVRAGGWNPLAHFLGPGMLEGCNPNGSFDALAYLQEHAGLVALGLNPALSYLEQDPDVLRRNSGL